MNWLPGRAVHHCLCELAPRQDIPAWTHVLYMIIWLMLQSCNRFCSIIQRVSTPFDQTCWLIKHDATPEDHGTSNNRVIDCCNVLLCVSWLSGVGGLQTIWYKKDTACWMLNVACCNNYVFDTNVLGSGRQRNRPSHLSTWPSRDHLYEFKY